MKVKVVTLSTIAKHGGRLDAGYYINGPSYQTDEKIEAAEKELKRITNTIEKLRNKRQREIDKHNKEEGL